MRNEISQALRLRRLSYVRVEVVGERTAKMRRRHACPNRVGLLKFAGAAAGEISIAVADASRGQGHRATRLRQSLAQELQSVGCCQRSSGDYCRLTFLR